MDSAIVSLPRFQRLLGDLSYTQGAFVSYPSKGYILQLSFFFLQKHSSGKYLVLNYLLRTIPLILNPSAKKKKCAGL